MSDIFISHIEEDADIAIKIASGLEGRGYTTWYYERDSLIGPQYLLQIPQAIKQSKAMLVIISPDSLGSNQVTNEVISAYEDRKYFIPLLRNITHSEFQQRQPLWKQAIGAATSSPIPKELTEDYFSRIIKGLKYLGIQPSVNPDLQTEIPIIFKNGKQKDYISSNQGDGIRFFEIEPRTPSEPILGREKDIEDTLELLNKKYSFAVVGIKGVGKSKFVSALLERVKNDNTSTFKTYYWRCFALGYAPSFTEFGRKIIEDLTNVNVEEFGKITVGEQIQAVVRVLKEKQCFLVIDQFEAVINPETKKPEDQGFAEFLTCANEGLEPARVVVTGWEVPLDSRGMPFKAKILDGINASASRKLWEHHDLNINTNKMPKETKERLLEEIILRLHGHPFAIQVIARNYSITEIQEMLENTAFKESPLASKVADISSSVYTRLPQKLKRFLSSICIFSKPCGLSAMSYITDYSKGDTLQTLIELEQRGIISKYEDRTYDVHNLLKEPVLSQLSNGERMQLHIKAASYYANQPCPSIKDRKSINDVNHFLSAIEHYISANKYLEAVELFINEKLQECLYSWGHCGELERICKIFIERKDVIPKDMFCKVLGALGLIYRDYEKSDEAKKYFEEALEIAKYFKYKEVECEQMVNLGDIHYYLGIKPPGSISEIDISIKYHNEAARYFGEVIDRKLEAKNIGCLGNAFLAKKDYKSALECYEKTLNISREINDKRYEGIWSGNIGAIKEIDGNLEEAKTYFNKAISLAQETGDRKHESWWLGILGEIYLYRLKDYKNATNNLEGALSLSEKILFTRGMKRQLDALWRVYYAEGKYQDAVRCYEKLRMAGCELERSDIGYIANICFVIGEYNKSIDYYKEILNIDRKASDKQGEIRDLFSLGDIYIKLGQSKKAIEYYNDAFAVTRQTYPFILRNEPLLLEIENIIKRGEAEKALEKCTALILKMTSNTFAEWIKSYSKAYRVEYPVAALAEEIEEYENGMINVTPNTKTFMGLANLYARKGELERAIVQYNKAFECDPNNIVALLSMMEVMVWDKQYGESINIYSNLGSKV